MGSDTHKEHPLASDVPKGTLYQNLIFKGLGMGSGEQCHRLHTDRQAGMHRGGIWTCKQEPGRDLSASAQSHRPPPTRPPCGGTGGTERGGDGGRAGFLHMRHDISELIPNHQLPGHLLPGPATAGGWDLNST